MPQLVFDVEHGENVKATRKDMATSSAEILEVAGFKNVEAYDRNSEPGLSIHEKGTARMSKDPKASVLNRWSQLPRYSEHFRD